MNAGALRHRITIQHEAVSQNTFNEEEKGWVPFANTWAAVEPIKGREYFDSQQVNSEVTHQIKMRYRPGVTAEMRVVFKGRIFEIESVLNIGERNVELQLMCIERGAAQ